MLNNAIMTSITGHHFTIMFCLSRIYQAISSVMDWIPDEQFIGFQILESCQSGIKKIILFQSFGIQSDICQPYTVSRWNQSYFWIKFLILLTYLNSSQNSRYCTKTLIEKPSCLAVTIGSKQHPTFSSFSTGRLFWC